MRGRWQFWIDRGGTFTDCLGRDPRTGEIHSIKVLSSDRAPLVGIRSLLRISDDEAIPPCDVRMGTTIATNALLERRGVATALVITEGFADALAIGNQTRPGIFDLDIVKPELLYSEVIETAARGKADGTRLATADPEALRPRLERAFASGVRSLAIVVLHAYAQRALEEEIADIAEQVGFAEIAMSSEVANEIGLTARGDTTVVDAYLTPLIKAYVATLRAELAGSTLHIMQSSGDLAAAALFRGKNAILSGPAGGVVACGHIARRAGYERALGFDMGGTSTDVSCWDGRPAMIYENEVAGVRLRSPMMDIHTVAAGGGSICSWQGLRFTVGPRSAGATPGPLCYGDPSATELTVTDVNYLLGRVVDDRFPFELSRERADEELERLWKKARDDGHHLDRMDTAVGLLEIANTNMAAAIRDITIGRGRDARDYALVVFGGAGGQHGCAVARMLGIRTLLFDRHAGVLSALGMGLADVAWHGQHDGGRRELSNANLLALEPTFATLEAEGRASLRSEGHAEDIVVSRQHDLRYRGTEMALTCEGGDADQLRQRFEEEHLRRFGYVRPEAIVEIVTLRIVVAVPSHVDIEAKAPRDTTTAPRRTQMMWTGSRWGEVPVYDRESLTSSASGEGPCLILDDTGTVVVDEGWQWQLDRGTLVLVDHSGRAVDDDDRTGVDPIRLEIFNNLFMSVATQMGTALRRTAVSTNIRERLDFSCAVFDGSGNLVANAPHIPVHLGAMSETIKGVLAAHPTPPPGSVFISNDPRIGGSHLPDITVVTPVHDDAGVLRFFTASRGHHEDVGGISPGSMPPHSTTLSQEGVVFEAIAIVEDQRFAEKRVRDLLTSGPHPARRPDDNIADIKAQIAANRAGAAVLSNMCQLRGTELVLEYMGHVQHNAANEVAAAIRKIAPGAHRMSDAMDDGTPIAVEIERIGERLRIDFRGTGPRHSGNLNAPRAVTVAAVFYVLRTLVAAPIPLNSGFLSHVDIIIPPGSLLDPSETSAVAAGNVETSQRIVDVLLGALGVAAASQGTMNNLTFGNDSFGYYETIAGGAGATSTAAGASAVQTHMTNTRITDAEVLEAKYPVKVREFSIRRGSGGDGLHRGGDGVIRELVFEEPVEVSMISERRARAPFGAAGGEPGQKGENRIDGDAYPGRFSQRVEAGSSLRIETPGGGGYGKPPR